MTARPVCRVLRAALCGLAALAIAPSLASAQSPGAQSFTGSQKEEIARVVREYLLGNPEVIQEAIALLEKKQADAQKSAQAKALRESGDVLLRSPYDTVVGNGSGDVTVVEFFDYNCPYCKTALGDLQGLLKSDPKLRIVLKDLPVLGPESAEAHRVAVAAKQQLAGDKAFEYHSRLIATRGRVNGERALALARDMGLDLARLQRDMDGATVRTAIDQTRRLSEQLGINGTPAYVVGDEVMSGAVGQGPLRQAIGSVRQCGHAVC